MSNLSGVQFQSKDWNPFLAAGNFISKITPESEKEKGRSRTTQKEKTYSDAMTQQSHTEKTTLTKQEKPTPANTGAPTPGYLKRGPITPSTTGAPVPGTLKNNTAIHPITGARVPRVPVKRKGSKPTAPGTRPKKK